MSGTVTILSRSLQHGALPHRGPRTRFVTVNMFNTVFNQNHGDCHADGGLPRDNARRLSRHRSARCSTSHTPALDRRPGTARLARHHARRRDGRVRRTPQINPRGGRDHCPAAGPSSSPAGHSRRASHRRIRRLGGGAEGPPGHAGRDRRTIYAALGLDSRRTIPGPTARRCRRRRAADP